MMLFWMPFLVTGIAALGMLAAFWRWRDVRFPWLVGLPTWPVMLMVWGGLHGQLPLTVPIGFWEAGTQARWLLALRLDAQVWPFLLALTALALAAWLQEALATPDRHWWRWIVWLGLVVAAWTAIMAADGLVLLLAWTAFDALDFLLAVGGLPEGASPGNLLRALALRAISLYLLLWGGLQSGGLGQPLAFAAMPGMLAQMMWLAVGMRLLFTPMPTTSPERGAPVLRQGSFLLVSGAALVRVAGAEFSPWGVTAGLWLAVLLALGLWWWPAPARWMDGWVMALGGVLWGLTPWLPATMVLAASLVAALSGALLAWLDVSERLSFGMAAALLGWLALLPWVEAGLWRDRQAIAVPATLCLAFAVAAGARRLRALQTPMPEARVERALWYGSLGTLLLVACALSLGRVRLSVSALPVALLSALLLVWDVYGRALERIRGLRNRLARAWPQESGLRLWGWAAALWQRLVRGMLYLLEGPAGLGWSVLLMILWMLAFGGGR